MDFYASAIIPNRISEGILTEQMKQDESESGGEAIKLSWNPASAISAKTLIMAAENRLKKIDDAILICSPPAVFKKPAFLNPREIEILVDDHIKGWFYIIRELILYFKKTGAGLLSLVLPDINSDYETRNKKNTANPQFDLLGPSAMESFRSFANGIISSSVEEDYTAMGFSGSEAGQEQEYASWLFGIVDKAANEMGGRWHRYKKGLFSSSGKPRKN